MRCLIVLACLVACRIGFDTIGDAPPQASDAVVPDAGPCSEAGFTCAGAVTVSMCGGQCWSFCSEPMPHAAAVLRCQAWGGQLPRIESSGDVACSLSVQTFGGWHDRVQPAGQTTPIAGWVHGTNGAVPAYTNWNGGQPEDGDTIENDMEQCSFTQYPLGFWQDEECGRPAQVVCRR